MASRSGPIIILEDDADEQELLGEMFVKIGVANKLIYFSTGIDVLAYLKSTTEQPFLIISDVNVPLMNGLELKKVINDDDYLRKKSIPFIFLSTSAEKKAVETAYDLTVQGFFLKQNTVSEIERHLRLIVDYWRECKHTNSD
jgi:CheY-like chemotaxis protein